MDAVARAPLGVHSVSSMAFERALTQRGAIAHILVDGDEPLIGIAEDDAGPWSARSADRSAPAARAPRDCPPRSAHRQRPCWPGLPAPPSCPRCARFPAPAKSGICGRYAPSGPTVCGMGSLGVMPLLVGHPGGIVLSAVARRGMDKAGALLVGDVIAFEQRHAVIPVGIGLRQRVRADETRHIGITQPLGLHDEARLGDVFPQGVSHDQLVRPDAPRAGSPRPYRRPPLHRGRN